MNEYDAMKMADVMCHHKDMEVTSEESKADVFLLNTCSIREKPQEKVFHQLGRWKAYKDKNPQIVIGVGGCVASQEGSAIIKRAPYVDMVFGPQTLHRLPSMYDQVISTKNPIVDISFPKVEKFNHLPKAKNINASAFVSIMEGCSKFCTFCVVPYTRGLEVLSDLIERVTEIEGIDRIRFTTSHPLQFTDDLIAAYNHPKLANYLHLPIQSGSNRILKLMHRKHNVQLYIDRISKLRALRPNISIASDFIVGFPGETEEDFQETLNIIDEVGFDQSFSFIYSPRPQTPAALMDDAVSYQEKLERLNRLQSMIKENTLKISKEMIGTDQTILVEKLSKKMNKQISGRTENNRWVNFDGPISLIGQFIKLRITEALSNSLRARIIN